MVLALIESDSGRFGSGLTVSGSIYMDAQI